MMKLINVVIYDTSIGNQEDDVSPQQTMSQIRDLTLRLQVQILKILLSIRDHLSEFRSIITLKIL